MSLFERVKNKRYDLQEKRKFPGDESGAYKQAKDDLEARKGFKKNKPGGLKADGWLFGDYDAYESFDINTKKVSSEDESV